MLLRLLHPALSGIRNDRFFDFLRTHQVLPITKKIGHRAAVYVEEHSLATSIRAGDAIIAATAVEHSHVLITGDRSHFKGIQGLKLKTFKP